MMDAVLLSSLLFLRLLSGVTATEDPEVVGSHDPVTAVVGDDVILPCHLEPPFDVHSLTVEWTHNKMTVHLYRTGKDHPGSQDESYKGRTALFLEEMAHGNISLKLMNVTKNDAGIYTCFVPKLHSQVRKGNINLNVEPKGEEDRRKDDPKKDLHPAAIFGIVIGLIIAIALIAAIVLIAVVPHVRKRNQQPQRQNNVDPPAEEDPLQERPST